MTPDNDADGEVVSRTDRDRLFVALNSEPYRSFERGYKSIELRGFGAQFNLDTVRVGRPVELRRGYNTDDSLWGTITARVVADTLDSLVDVVDYREISPTVHGEREFKKHIRDIMGEKDRWLAFSVDVADDSDWYCPDCDTVLDDLVWDFREDEDQPIQCGQCGNTDTQRVATDGGVPETVSEVVCVDCETSPRLLSLDKNDGTCVGCSCDDKIKLDSVPYEYSVSDFKESWVVIEGRTPRQMANEVDALMETDHYECDCCGAYIGSDAVSCSECGWISEDARLAPDGGEIEQSGSGNQHHLYTDEPECTWCRQEFEDRQTVVTLQWEFPSSTTTVLFCSHECATEWDCGNSRKSRGEVICHV